MIKAKFLALLILTALLIPSAGGFAKPTVKEGTPLPANWDEYGWEIQHKVIDGEYLYMLAGFYYSDGKKWNWIHATNMDKIVNPNRIKRGAVLTIRVPKGWKPPMPYSVWYERTRDQAVSVGYDNSTAPEAYVQ